MPYLGKNVRTYTGVPDGSVDTDSMLDGAVTGTKLASGTVAANALASSAVTTAKINAGAVTSSKLAQTGLNVTGNTVTANVASSTIVVNNTGVFNCDIANNFKCTPSGSVTLHFNNANDGQSGTILLVNTGGQTISANTTTKVMGSDLLTTITTAGTYVLGYVSDGTNTRIYNSGAQQ